MKNGKNGFTLIEILVVIAVITFLAGISFVSISAIKESTRRNLTLAWATQTAAAIHSFHTQHSDWPTDTLRGSRVPPQKWYEFLNHGYTKVMDGAMPKYETSTVYLELPARAVDSSGEIIDAWGRKLVIKVDSDKGTVLVYSIGPDGVDGTDDDIRSK